MAYADHVGRGWKNILDELEETAGQCKTPVVVDQIKEKFGTLRFYYNGGDQHFSSEVARAEELSGITCEVCGDPGRSRSDRGWIKTLCNEHAND